jgi:hypothetical protein
MLACFISQDLYRVYQGALDAEEEESDEEDSEGEPMDQEDNFKSKLDQVPTTFILTKLDLDFFTLINK